MFSGRYSWVSDSSQQLPCSKFWSYDGPCHSMGTQRAGITAPALEAVLLFLHVIPSRSSRSLPQALFSILQASEKSSLKLSSCLVAHSKY